MKTRYEILDNGKWRRVRSAVIESRLGQWFLRYELKEDGTIGFARPGTWRIADK